jgi:hypothetical protein
VDDHPPGVGHAAVPDGASVIRRQLARLLAALDGPLTDRWPDLVYAVRPYDALADARRWRWQRAHPSQHRVGIEEWARWGFRFEPGRAPLVVVWPTSPDWPRDDDPVYRFPEPE